MRARAYGRKTFIRVHKIGPRFCGQLTCIWPEELSALWSKIARRHLKGEDSLGKPMLLSTRLQGTCAAICPDEEPVEEKKNPKVVCVELLQWLKQPCERRPKASCTWYSGNRGEHRCAWLATPALVLPAASLTPPQQSVCTAAAAAYRC